FDALAEPDFEVFQGLGLEILLIGTGPTQRFPHPRLTRALMEKRIGVEVMDTQAACRTYNILIAEGRRVAAAILLK
ncbi:MAG TPA: MTH938/NDUFAF3 family protein, partial [Burkholderiales bacterium]|nr:MTH938/NDUFAF3 family protein [Burkholderiales bacterium]